MINSNYDESLLFVRGACLTFKVKPLDGRTRRQRKTSRRSTCSTLARTAYRACCRPCREPAEPGRRPARLRAPATASGTETPVGQRSRRRRRRTERQRRMAPVISAGQRLRRKAFAASPGQYTHPLARSPAPDRAVGFPLPCSQGKVWP